MPTEKKHGQDHEQVQAEREQRVIPNFQAMPAGPLESPESGIGKRLEFVRKQLGLSIEALARYTVPFDLRGKKGISPTSLLRYESGEYVPGAREIRILCDVFAASPRWLIYGELDNAGGDAKEQALIQALEAYVVNRAKEPRLEDGTSWRKKFDEKPTDAQRLDWLIKAKTKKPAQGIKSTRNAGSKPS